MIPNLITAEYVEKYIVNLTFADNKVRTIDLEPELEGEVFEPLKDIDIFKSFIVRQEFGTIEWKNGADFAPEFLYGVDNAG